MNPLIKKGAIALVILAALNWVGSMEKEDQEMAQAHYCDMVAQGAWPDYKKTYQEECN